MVRKKRTREEIIRQQAERLEITVWTTSDLPLLSLMSTLPKHLQLRGLDILDVLKDMSDEGLVLAIKKGFFVKQAYEALMVHRYQAPLLRCFHHWGTFVGEPQDLCQWLNLKFLQNGFASFRFSTEERRNLFRPYLFRAARNLWVQALRIWKKDKDVSALGDLEPVDPAPGPPDELWNAEFERLLHALLNEFGPIDRSIALLTMEGASLAAIVEALSLTYRAVTIRLHRLRKQLAKRLGEELGLSRPARAS